jgi:hypothetical protein
VVPVIVWALQHTLSELSNLINLASKALPMLALFGTFLFLNVDMWHIASYLPRHQLWTVVGFFAIITFLFLLVRLPDEVRKLRGGYTLASVREAAESTPLQTHVDDLDSELPQLMTNRKQRVNMLFVLGFTQVVQVLLLSLVVFLYFITLGTLAVSPEQMKDWLQPVTKDDMAKITDPGKLFGFPAEIPGTHVIFPEALIQTAILITTFSAFFFAVSAVTDEAYRKDFFESITGKLNRSLDIRCGYVNLYIKATRRLEEDSAGRGSWDTQAVFEDHQRTVQIPSYVAQPEALTLPVESFQPRPAQFGVVPEPRPAAPDPVAEDPFQRWPQQQQ